jgi:hypothetical protein
LLGSNFPLIKEICRDRTGLSRSLVEKNLDVVEPITHPVESGIQSQRSFVVISGLGVIRFLERTVAQVGLELGFEELQAFSFPHVIEAISSPTTRTTLFSIVRSGLREKEAITGASSVGGKRLQALGVLPRSTAENVDIRETLAGIASRSLLGGTFRTRSGTTRTALVRTGTAGESPDNEAGERQP